MNTELLNRIRDVIEQKKANRQEPAHALLQNLLFGSDRNEIIRELDQLRQQGKIKTGNTINDIFITINEQHHA